MSAPVSIDEAFAHCEERVRRHYENFPVGLFVPRDKRRYVHALYAFARAADDFADEPIYEGFREKRLDDWAAYLDAAYEGRAEGPIFTAIAETARRLDIPKALLSDLLSAFKQDVVKRRYENWAELIDYCRRSANPVGRLVLLICDYRDEELNLLSDCICTALQLANHWQDLAIDLNEKNRIYIPQDLMMQHGVAESDLRLSRVNGAYRALLAELTERTRELFARGRPLCDRVGRNLRFELRLTWLGGSSILDRIEAVGYDVFRRRPRHGWRDKIALALRAVFWRASRRQIQAG
ncbi:MAG: squalene synthase HpnC [Vicinamibacteria bacterium]|nr:squalene synthase HpnC [Vicinamibacteria bacterium]